MAGSRRTIALILANHEFVSDLLESHYRPDELPPAAVECYYLQLYRQDVKAGGMEQFVRNSRWRHEYVAYILTGLAKIDVPQHLALFQRLDEAISGFGPEVHELIEDGLVDEPDMASFLQECTDIFEVIEDRESLLQFMYAYLSNHPELRPLPDREWAQAMEALCAEVPNREARAYAAELAADPTAPFTALRRLCERAGQLLESVGEMSEREYEGLVSPCWPVATSAGPHEVIFTGSEAVLYDVKDEEQRARVDFDIAELGAPSEES